MKVYKDDKVMNADKEQMEIVLDAGWSTTKPESEEEKQAKIDAEEAEAKELEEKELADAEAKELADKEAAEIAEEEVEAVKELAAKELADKEAADKEAAEAVPPKPKKIRKVTPKKK